MPIKQVQLRKVNGLKKPSPKFDPTPDKNSNRSKKRKNRGFVSLEKSSRRHKRAQERLAISQTIGANHMGAGGVRYDAGTPVDPPTNGKTKTFISHAGGAVNYH